MKKYLIYNTYKYFAIVFISILLSIFPFFIVQAEDENQVLSGKCGESTTWIFENGELSIGGTGEMFDFANTVDADGKNHKGQEKPWADFADQVTEIDILNGVTGIGCGAFSDMNSLKKVTFSNTVTSIGEDAFSNDKNVTELILNEGLKTINFSAFYGMSITEITLPSTVSSLNICGTSPHF